MEGGREEEVEVRRESMMATRVAKHNNTEPAIVYINCSDTVWNMKESVNWLKYVACTTTSGMHGTREAYITKNNDIVIFDHANSSI